MSNVQQDIGRLFENFRKSKTPDSERIAGDLQQLYIKNSAYYDEVFQNLLKLINSNDLGEKYNGLLGLESISYVVQENQYMNFWNKFYTLVFQQFQQTAEERLLKKAGDVFGRLLRVGGTRMTNVLSIQIQSATDWLFYKNFNQNKKYAGLLVLKELLDQAPFVIFKVIISVNNYRFSIWSLIKNKAVVLRDAALSFFDILVKQISLKECKNIIFNNTSLPSKEIQDKEYSDFFDDIQQSSKAKEEEVIVGNISALKILMTYPRPDQFTDEQFNFACDYVFSKRDATPLIQKTVIDCLPILARFKKQVFASKFFTSIVGFLLSRINPPKQKPQQDLLVSYYDTLSRVCQSLDLSVMSKLSETTKAASFAQIQQVVKTIQTDLAERKAYIPSRISCLMSILKVFNARYAELIADEDLLINNVLFNGLYPQSIEFLKQISKLSGQDRADSALMQEGRKTSKRREVSASIQYRLLLCIITILSKQKNVFPNSLSPQTEKDKNFLWQLNSSSSQSSSSLALTDEKAIANAIQTLSTFGFSSYENELANFVKDNVLDFLENKNKNIRKAAAKAGCLLYVKKERGSLISKNIMYEILEKFMSVAISDPEDEIRQTMLKSLNENFDQYLNEPNYLKKLFLCVNDSNPQVQQLVLTILCRLAGYNPADIIPFLKMTLFELLSQLAFNDQDNEKKMIDLLASLGCLMKNGPELVRPHSQSIATILLNFLKDPSITNNMIPELLKAFSQLSVLGDFNILLFMDEIFPIFLSAMQDKSSTAKREAAVKSLVEILKNTGFVVLPYYKYPNFLEIILQLMKNEVNVEMRLQCMRLIGCLGAIDNFYYKKVSSKLKTGFSVSPQEDSMQIINLIISKTLKKKFKYFKNLQGAQQIQSSSKLTKQLHQYYEDIILLENFREKKMFYKLANMQSQQGEESKPDMKEQTILDKIQNKQELDEEIKALLQTPTVIALNDEDYYSRITLKALLKVLCDQSLNEHHTLAAETLGCIIGVLKTRARNFLDLLIPVFSKILSSDTLRDPDSILDLIQKTIMHCGRQFDQDYLDPVLEIFLEYGRRPVNQKISFNILDNLIDYQKRNLRHKIEPIIRLINNAIYKPQINQEFILKVIKIYTKLAELLDSNLHLIIPFLCTFMNRDVSQVNLEIKTEITKLFSCLAHKCSSTVQFLSLIVDSILNNLESNKGNPAMISSLMDAVVVFIFKYKNQFLVYLTKLNFLVKQQNIIHQAYSRCLEVFLNNGNLDDVPQQIEQEFIGIIGESGSDDQLNLINDAVPSGLYKKIESEKLIRVFDTSSNTSKEDWNQWMRKTSVELLKGSPNFVLLPCHQLAEVYEELQAELYNISFACVWSTLKDKEKEFIINQLTRAINPMIYSTSARESSNNNNYSNINNNNEGSAIMNQTNSVPINILQTILNLAEFMQHDKEGLQIDNSTLGDLAERCLAYAKALHYRENEFESANEQTIESLISLYTNLGQREAAKGLLQYVQKQLRMDVNMSWYERLHQWEYALDDYRVRQLNLPDQSFFVPKMRCLNALSDWEALLKSTSEEKNIESKKQVHHLAANAAMNLGKWDLLEMYTDNLPEENSQDKTFWQAAIAISKGNYEDSKSLVSESIMKLDSQVSGLLLESYSRAYESILRLQQLFEMQEIIEIKEFTEKINASVAGREGQVKASLDQELINKRQQLRDIWADRLAGNPKDIETWQKILSVRQLFFSKKEDASTWIKFCRLALKNNMMQICKKTLEELDREYEGSDLPPALQLANLECSYKISIAKEKEICDSMETLLNNTQNLDAKLTAKKFLKMGNWIRDKNEELNPQNMKKIEEFYTKAKEFKPDYYKTWHHFALLNFDAINIHNDKTNLYNENMMTSHQNEHQLVEEKHLYIKNALEGFMRSITLGTSSEYKSPYLLQDSLRLLQLIFDYGDIEEIYLSFSDGFKQIDNRAWIEVVPQIIARISTPKQKVQRILHQLLVHIANQHPQALIYPLTVACQSKVPIRYQAANQIIQDIQKHSPTLVKQALLISSELNRTAILLKEQWLEGIKEAWDRYTIDKGQYENLIKIMTGLHEMMKPQPESLSEISFHQNFGGDIFEAEAWLKRFMDSGNLICLCQVFDLYYRIYMKLNSQLDKLEFVYLENVSPKLLGTKNCEISIPGMYKPTRPVIKISCFQPKLEVLFSKMHPRKLFLYGSDSKEYHFLLKGREDIRQDERVMQMFALVNRLLHNNPDTEKKDLNITRYSIIPLSINTGLLGWVHNCDTLQVLIKEYRKAYNIRDNPEYNLMENFCSNFSVLPLPNKVEIFRHVIGDTKGEDLKKVLWLKSPNSEIWLERRTNYTRSLATMSIAGYILGLGDRHPSNIMLQRQTGKIVHIDFGDCFEVAMRREKFPEKVPFRLTRMLVNAMEACGIEGNYRHTCELVIKVVRENKESLIAVLEAFVYDPLFYWRLVTISGEEQNNKDKKDKENTNNNNNNNARETIIPENFGAAMFNTLGNNNANFVGSVIQQGTSLAIRKAIKATAKTKIQGTDKDKDRAQSPKNRDREISEKYYGEEEKERPQEQINKKALEVMDRIKKKLNGKDFHETESLSFTDQVSKLINQATSHENICQAFIGWCPFW